MLKLENKLIEEQKKVETLLTEKAIAEKRAKTEKLIMESKIQRTEAFFNALMRCEKDEEMKALIEDRQKASQPRIISRGVNDLPLKENEEKEKKLEEKILHALKS